jgi:putative tryptophan/tyrosine transport system substrate-binding protein
MRRRDLIRGTAASVIAWPLAARAQQPSMPVVGFLSGRSPTDSTANVAAFNRGLNEVGFFEEQNVDIEYRWALGHYDQLAPLAAELVHRKVGVILATGGGISSAQAAKAATDTIPIVFVAGTDPVAFGLVASLNNPGGNLTGVSFLVSALMPKNLELLRELVPKSTTFGVLVNPNYPDTNVQVRNAQAAAQALGGRLVVGSAGSEGELDTAFAKFVEERTDGIIVGADPFLNAQAARIAALAAHHALPAMYPIREFVLAGGLMSYGSSITDAHRQAGVYTGRILKGEKPTDLPVLQPTKFELVINLKTAKTLGLTVPQSLLVAADEVIE